MHKPLFSIGVPTYNRKGLLKQTLAALLAQTHTDFEVIVGNDFTEEPLSPGLLGITDPRIRFINNKKNIGELENMNSLLGLARGRYFTWQFDDDPCAPSFLREVFLALTKFGFPACVYTGYRLIYGTSAHKFNNGPGGASRLFSGRDFIRACLAGNLKALGSCGFYDAEYLRGIGGARRLTNGPMALHSEYLLLIMAGLLPEVAYVDAPLVSSRVHGDSWSCSNNDVELFKQAGINLVKESITVFSRGELVGDFQANLASVLKSVLSSVVMRLVMREKKLDKPVIESYAAAVAQEFAPLKGSPLHKYALEALAAAVGRLPGYVLKARLKMLTPRRFLKFAHVARSILSRSSGKAF